MQTLEQIAVSFIVSVLSSIVTFMITVVLYKNKEKKMQIFQTLMSTRGVMDYNAVLSLNIIDIVFYKSPKVCKAWSDYRSSMSISIDKDLTADQVRQRNNCHTKLLETIAVD